MEKMTIKGKEITIKNCSSEFSVRAIKNKKIFEKLDNHYLEEACKTLFTGLSFTNEGANYYEYISSDNKHIIYVYEFYSALGDELELLEFDSFEKLTTDEIIICYKIYTEGDL